MIYTREDYPTRSIAYLNFDVVGFELFKENNHEDTSPIIGIIRSKQLGRAASSL